jgi:hypothetical protein
MKKLKKHHFNFWERRIFADVADDFALKQLEKKILGCLAVRKVGFVSVEARGTSEQHHFL